MRPGASHPKPHVCRLDKIAFRPLVGDGTLAPVRQCSRDGERHIYRCSRKTSILANRCHAISAVENSPCSPKGTGSGGGRSAQKAERTYARLRFLVAIHPRELPVTAGSPQSSVGKPCQVLPFDASTLRQVISNRNIKSAVTCAETVEDGTCLWRAEEKSERSYFDLSSMAFAKCQAVLPYIVRLNRGIAIPRVAAAKMERKSMSPVTAERVVSFSRRHLKPSTA